MRIGLLLIRLIFRYYIYNTWCSKVFGGFKEPMAMMSDLGFPAFFSVILGLFEFIRRHFNDYWFYLLII